MPRVTVDFTGSDPQVEGSINAVEAITYSACFYVFRCLVQEDIPATAGLMRSIEVIAPAGTVVNARPPAAVAGGNVEMSQRIVDVLLRALAAAVPERIPAAASGTMNNLTIGGIDPRTGEPFAYYETIAGGMGARPTKDGVSGVHTHMTNSLNTPAEASGVRVSRCGCASMVCAGAVAVWVAIAEETAWYAKSNFSATRRLHCWRTAGVRAPWGLQGGQDGALGKAAVVSADGSWRDLPGKFNVRLKKGERIRIESPGAGGWGKE